MPCLQALGVLLWCVSWVDLFYSFHGLLSGSAPAPVLFVTPLVVGITMVSVGPRKLWGGLPWGVVYAETVGSEEEGGHMAVVRG